MITAMLVTYHSFSTTGDRLRRSVKYRLQKHLKSMDISTSLTHTPTYTDSVFFTKMSKNENLRI